MYTTGGNSEIGLFDGLKPIDIVIGSDRAQIKYDSIMDDAAYNAAEYISPTDEDIAEAGPEWKKGGVHYFLETCDFRNDSGTLTQISDIHAGEVLQPLPVFGFIDEFGEIKEIPKIEVEELEVINIELSDYPIPENPTTYDWWWA